MQPIATDGEEWSVGRPVMIMSPAKNAKPNDMPFGVWTWVGQRNQIPHGKGKF